MVLSGRAAGIDELSAAREVWDWHRRFNQGPEVKAAAEALEALYASNDIAKEFQPLLPSVEDWKENDGSARSKAQDLALASSPNDILAFIDRAVLFLRSDSALYRLHHVAWSLGQIAESFETVRKFIEGALTTASIDQRAEFGVVAAVSWIGAVRVAVPGRAHVLVRSLLGICGSDDRRAHLMERIYGRVPKLHGVGTFTEEECELLRNSHELFTKTGRDVRFVAALALAIVDRWPALHPHLEKALGAVPPDRFREAFRALLDSVYWSVHDCNNLQPSKELAGWLLDQLLKLPDLDELDGEEEWRLTAILKRVGTPSVKWLPDALRWRRDQESASGDKTGYRAVGYNVRVSKYARQIDHSNATDDEVTSAVEQLLEFLGDNNSLGDHLPEVLHDFDPAGLVVPAAVDVRARSVNSAEVVRRLSRVASAYSVNSPPWRAIALATIRASENFGPETLRAVYGSLGEMGVRSWWSAVDEVAPIFSSAVAEARSTLDAETRAELRPYWQQRLDFAEAQLLEERESAKERRGE